MEAADGVVRVNAGVLEACVRSDRFAAWFSSRALVDSVIAFLAVKGILDFEPGGRVLTKQVRLPTLSYRPRCYVVRLTPLEAL